MLKANGKRSALMKQGPSSLSGQAIKTFLTSFVTPSYPMPESLMKSETINFSLHFQTHHLSHTKIMKTTSLLTLATFAFAGSMSAQDKAGSADHPILKRYAGSQIVQYSQQAYAEYKLAMGKALNPSVPSSNGKAIEKEETLEGKLTRISYVAPAGRSSLEVFRNYQQDLRDKGFKVLFTGEKEELGYMFCSRYAGIQAQLFDYNQEGNRFIAARLERPEGNITVAVFVADFVMGLHGGIVPAPIKGQPIIQVDVLEDKPMEERMVVVSAEKMQTSIQNTGRIALYGIYFDFNKADVKAESMPTIEQMAKLLNSLPSMKLLIVGHTDNVGGFDYNADLSQRRAAAVVAQLINQHGIAATRLTPKGASFMAPIATNRTDEGRAKNRRVELVEQ
jgi:OmpA-OmpF porin, OOP family